MEVPRRGRRRLLTASCCLGLVAASAFAGPGEPTGRPAVWEQHAIVVRLRNLPKRYFCDELRDKLREVLLRVGARADIEVRPYRCERALGGAARSPVVRLKFFVPRAVETPLGRPGDLRAVSRTIRVAPGEPASIDASDCVLLRQIKTALPGKVVAFKLACLVPQIATPPFSVSIRTLMPLADDPIEAARSERQQPRS